MLKSLLSYAPDFFSPQLFFVVAEPFFTQLLHIYISLQLLLQKRQIATSITFIILTLFCGSVTALHQ
jgi:hypothetical protein